MRLIYKIAARNLLRHKRRSIAVGIIIFIGAFFMTLGNGAIVGMQKGIEFNIVKGLLGDISIISAERKEDNLSGSLEDLTNIERFEEVDKIISEQEDVHKHLFVLLGAAAMLDISMVQGSANDLETITFWGVNYDEYQEMYGDNIEIIEGEALKKGEKGILINTTQRDRIFNLHDMWLLPENGSIVKDNLTTEALAAYDNLRTRNDLVLIGISGTTTSTDVRVPIKGIFKYKQINELIGEINFIDSETARECLGYITAADLITDLSEDDQKLLNAFEDEENLFSDDIVSEQDFSETSAFNYDENLKSNEKEKVTADYDKGAFTLGQVNIKQGASPEIVSERLNHAFKEANLDKVVRAVSWRQSWSVLSGYAGVVGSGLMVFINCIYFAAILMIANTLSMAAMERTGEIGTMRVIGAQKRFTSGMFVAETSVLSFFFGVMGILSGITAIMTFNVIEFKTASPYLQLVFGGSVFRPILEMNGIITGIFQLAVITVLGLIYPVVVARRIKPIDAMKRN
jgi:putative ABC transport system permease protein